MHTICLYSLQIRGQVDENEINAISPLQIERVWTDTAVTQFTVQTDQSGLLGLVRYLHNRGFVFNKVQYEIINQNNELCHT